MAFVKHVGCPNCGSSDGVGVYSDNGQHNGKCYSCGKDFWNMNLADPSFTQQTANIPQNNTGLTVQQILEFPVMACPERGLEYEEASQVGIRTRVDEYGKAVALYYPYYKSGNLTAFKERILAEKKFRTIGDFKGCDLYRSHLYTDGGKMVVLTEGEDDADAAQKIWRYLGKPSYRVMSIQTGATVDEDGKGIIDKPLKRQLPKLLSYDTVILCLDQDAPGMALSVALAEELAGDCEVKFMNFEKKDAKEMADHQLGYEFDAALRKAKLFTPDSILRGEDIDLDWLMKPIAQGLPTPYDKLNRMMDGLRYCNTEGKDGENGSGELSLLAGGTGVGKAQPKDSKVLLANGQFKLMGDLELGDSLASVDGQPSEVVGIYPQGMREAYELTFSDGRKVKCDGDHLWLLSKTGHTKNNTDRILAAKQIKDLLKYKKHQNRIIVPFAAGDFGQQVESILHPWLLGVLLGDGCLTQGIVISNSNKYIREKVKELMPLDMEIAVKNECDFRLVKRRSNGNPILDVIRGLGLGELKSYKKFIPDVYFTADKKTRLALLQGLVETDGTVNKGGCVQFTSSSEALADGVTRLVRSLGGRAKKASKVPTYTYLGQKRVGRKSYTITIGCQALNEVIEEPLRKSRVNLDRANPIRLSIVSVDVVGEEECQCIKVSHPSELYLTDDYTVTHNTTLAREIGQFLHTTQGQRIGNIYLEEQAKKTAQGAVAIHYNIPLRELRKNPDLLTREQWQHAKDNVLAGDTFYCHFGSLSSDVLLNKIRYMNIREGCNFIVLDNITLVSSGQDAGMGGERKDIDILMTKLAAFVTVTGCHILALIHLKRRNSSVKKDKDGKLDPDFAPYNRGGRISIDDMRGSSCLEQLAFNIIAIEGNQDEDNGNDKNLRWLRLLKCRETGDIGQADFLRYDPLTGRLLPIGGNNYG